MLVSFANSKMLFATNYLTLFSIYHIHGFSCRVLSKHCVYISGHNRADDFGRVTSRGALSRHRFGVSWREYRVGGGSAITAGVGRSWATRLGGRGHRVGGVFNEV